MCHEAFFRCAMELYFQKAGTRSGRAAIVRLLPHLTFAKRWRFLVKLNSPAPYRKFLLPTKG